MHTVLQIESWEFNKNIIKNSPQDVRDDDSRGFGNLQHFPEFALLCIFITLFKLSNIPGKL